MGTLWWLLTWLSEAATAVVRMVERVWKTAALKKLKEHVQALMCKGSLFKFHHWTLWGLEVNWRFYFFYAPWGKHITRKFKIDPLNTNAKQLKWSLCPIGPPHLSYLPTPGTELLLKTGKEKFNIPQSLPKRYIRVHLYSDKNQILSLWNTYYLLKNILDYIRG